MTSSGGLERSSPSTRSIAGTTTRITTGPIQNGPGQPVASHPPYPMKNRLGTTSPISHRYRFRSRHRSFEPAGTVVRATASIRGPTLLLDISPVSVKWLYMTVRDVKPGGKGSPGDGHDLDPEVRTLALDPPHGGRFSGAGAAGAPGRARARRPRGTPEPRSRGP